MFDCLQCVAEVDAAKSYCHLCLAESRVRVPLKEKSNEPKAKESDKKSDKAKELPVRRLLPKVEKVPVAVRKVR